MTRKQSILLQAGVLAFLAVLLTATLRLDRSIWGKEALAEIDVVIRDSSETQIVSGEEISRILMHGGFAVGTPMEQLDLFQIERMIGQESCVTDCEAYLTPDHSLHIELEQRRPVVRFMTPEGGFYADASGYIIPLGERYVSRVPLIHGDIGISVPKGWIGRLEDKDADTKLRAYTELASALKEDPHWAHGIAEMRCDPTLGLLIYPMDGPEVYIFGSAENIAEKIDKMNRYLSSVVPYKGGRVYKSVDLRFDKQIICKK